MLPWIEGKRKNVCQFIKETPKTVDNDNTWEWTRKGVLKVEMKALIFGVDQDQAPHRGYVKFNVDQSVNSLLCSVWAKGWNSKNHIFSECETLS